MIRHVRLEPVQLNNMNESITTRIFLVRRLLRTMGIDPLDIYDQYVGQVFCSGLPKQIVFRDFLVNDSVGIEVLRELGSMCSDSQFASFRDSRSAEQYASELVLGWIIEDALCLALNTENTSASLTGSDQGRDFLQPEAITTSQDLLVKNDKVTVSLEVLTDYSNYWARTDTCDLRYNKLETSTNDDASKYEQYVLGISLQQPSFFLASPKKSNHLVILPKVWHEKWNKPVRQIKGVSAGMQPVRNLKNAIASIDDFV